jgi:hypothetical protein
MQERNFPQGRPGVSPGHKLIAVVVAIAVAVGVHTWFNRNAADSASAAQLSFDPSAANRIDEGLAAASQPAVATAQSILTDSVIAGLSKSAGLPSSVVADRIGEFRSRLILAQPSARLLTVQFRDPHSATAIATSNAVAQTLAAWSPPSSSSLSASGSPSSAAAPPPASSSQPAGASQPPPVPAAPSKKLAPARRNLPVQPLSAALGDLEAQLSSTDQQLTQLSSPSRRTGSRSSSHSFDLPSYSQYRQQQLLKSGLKEAQQKLDDLRVQYAGEFPGTGIQDRLVLIQQELASILPSGASRYGFNAAGVSAGEIRRERAQLSNAVGVVARQRQAIQRQEPAQPASASASASASGSASPSASGSGSQPGPDSLTESDIGSRAGSPAGSSPNSPSTSAAAPPTSAQEQPGPSAPPSSAVAGSHNPLQLARLAGASSPFAYFSAPSWTTQWWPALAAGFLCFLLYLGIAARAATLAYRRLDEIGSDTDDTPHFGYRLITPDAPVFAPAPEPRPTPDPEPRVESRSGPRPEPPFRSQPGFDPRPTAAPQRDEQPEPRPSRRASFTFDPPAPAGNPVSARVSAGPLAPPSNPPESGPSTTDPSVHEPENPVAGREASPIATAQARPFDDNSSQIPDSWVDSITKALSQTEIARSLENAKTPDNATSPGQENDRQQSSPHPSRRAG